MPVYLDKKTDRLFVQFDLEGCTYKKRMPEGTTKATAAKFETKWKHDLFFAAHLPEEREVVLWKEFVENVYLPNVKANNSQAQLERAIFICKAAKPFFGDKPINEVKPSDVERFKDSRVSLPTQHGTKRKPATVHREMSFISRVFTLAERNDLVTYNPCKRVDLPKFDNIQNRILKIEDEDLFLKSIRCRLQRDAITTALYTGLRQEDFLGLTKDNIDLSANELRVFQGKTQRWVTIPILPKLREILINRMNGDLLFPSDRTGEQMKSIRGSIMWACHRAGIPRLTARDLRRTFGTRLHENGFDDKTIADLLGHAGLRSVFRYKRGTEIKKKAILSLENMTGLYPNPTNRLNDLSNGSPEPNKTLVETRGIEPLTSAMPLLIPTNISH